MTDDEVKMMGKFAEDFPNLMTFDLKVNRITQKGLKEMLDAAENFPNLTTIDLSLFDQFRFNNGDEAVNLLSNTTGKFPNLRTINLRQNTITTKGVKILMSASKKLSKLTTLDLKGNKITAERVQILVTAGNQFKMLEDVSLQGRIRRQLQNQKLPYYINI